MEKTKEVREISTQTEQDRFKTFLGVEENNQILFSGIYGSGKTYFLNKFFENQEGIYDPIFISPANYPVASNEDIFEYIKIEVLIELFKKTEYFKTEKFSFSLVAETVIKDHLGSLFVDVVKLVENHLYKIGYVSFFRNLCKKIIEIQKATETDEKQDALDFLNGWNARKGSIFEEDSTTILIRKLVERYEKENENKKIVLVIDDLDRLDPDHVFRILNILSVHNNYHEGNEHKFGISKTILVCDIENIKHIFHGRYGEKVDFEGYIDKFFSTEIFKFDNVENVKNVVSEIMKHAKSSIAVDINRPEFTTGRLVFTLISIFIEKRHISLRQLLSCERISVTVQKNKLLIDRTYFPIDRFPEMVAFCYVETICGSLEKFEIGINELKDDDFTWRNIDITRDYHLLYYADFGKNQFNISDDHKYQGINYVINNHIDVSLTDRSEDINVENISYADLIQDSFATYKKHFR